MTARAFDAVLFDLDGTLLDSLELIVASYQHTQRVHDLPPRDRETILHHVGKSLLETFRTWAPGRDEAHVEACIATYVAHNLTAHDALVRAFPGVIDSVVDLHARGERLGIVTSKKRRGALRGLSFLGLTHPPRFDVVVCADDTARHKPHPAPVQLALRSFDPPARAARTLFIGDSAHDIAAGNAAGVTTVAVTWGAGTVHSLRAASPDHIVSSAADLADLLELT